MECSAGSPVLVTEMGLGLMTCLALPSNPDADQPVPLSPTDAALMRTAVVPGAVCGLSPYRGCGIFGRSQLLLVSDAFPA